MEYHWLLCVKCLPLIQDISSHLKHSVYLHHETHGAPLIALCEMFTTYARHFLTSEAQCLPAPFDILPSEWYIHFLGLPLMLDCRFQSWSRLLLLLHFQLHLCSSPFWVRFLRMWSFFFCFFLSNHRGSHIPSLWMVRACILGALACGVFSSLSLVIIIMMTWKGTIQEFLQSPICAVNCLQHICTSGQGAVMCK